MKTLRRLKEELLGEGNPLARDVAQREQGLHKLFLSAERSELGPQENKMRTRTLEDDLKKSGHAFRKTKGVWKGGEEDSFEVHAKSPEDHHTDELLDLGRHLMKRYDQDAITHRKPDGSAHFISHDGSDDFSLSATAYQRENPVGETQYGRDRPPHKRRRMTFVDREASAA